MAGGGRPGLGVHVPDIVRWTSQHPVLTVVLKLPYGSLLPQFTLPVLAVGFWYRDRGALWEYLFHFHFCAAVTIACLAVWPAACALTFYGFDSLLDQERFTRHFQGFRSGALTVVNADDLEGLISMPSFHVAGGMMVTWAFRAYPKWLIPVALLNVGLIAATVLAGAHYAIDLVATVALFAAGVWLYRVCRINRWHLA